VHTTIRGMLVGLLMTSALVACAQQPADTASADNEVAAKFGDTVITVAEVEKAVDGQLLQFRQQMYQVKDQQLQKMIYDALVDKAAADEGITRDEYLKREITDKVAEPSEEQIKQVMDQYRSQLAPDDAQARQQVVSYLQQQGRGQQEMALKTRLFEEAGVQIMLEPPRVEPVIEAANPSRGPADAPITFIEYTDFQCPYCGRVQSTIEALRERYGDQMLHIFKNLPLPMHQQAGLAAEAGMCAADQGKFWELHDWLFANKSNISRDTLMAEAETLGLDTEAFGVCIDTQTHQAQIEADAAEAGRFGIRGTPGFVINGRVVTGAQPFENFVQIFDDELRRAGLPIPGTEQDEGAKSES
jgi:predicted DsbA family dithiol-disulfide isomerase